MRIKSFFVLALTMFSCAATAADWMLLVGDKDMGIFVDMNSLQMKGNIHRAWFKLTFSPPTPDQEGKLMSYSLIRTSFNCADQTDRDDSVVIFFSDGTSETTPAKSTAPWVPIAPESVDETESKFACNKW